MNWFLTWSFLLLPERQWLGISPISSDSASHIMKWTTWGRRQRDCVVRSRPSSTARSRRLVVVGGGGLSPQTIIVSFFQSNYFRRSDACLWLWSDQSVICCLCFAFHRRLKFSSFHLNLVLFTGESPHVARRPYYCVTFLRHRVLVVWFLSWRHAAAFIYQPNILL